MLASVEAELLERIEASVQAHPIDPHQREDLRLVRVDGVCLHGRLNAFQQFCLDGSQHLVNVGVVQVKGGTVHVGVGDQLFYGDVACVFLLHQLGQALAQQGTGTQDAAVGFGCRHKRKILSGALQFL